MRLVAFIVLNVPERNRRLPLTFMSCTQPLVLMVNPGTVAPVAASSLTIPPAGAPLAVVNLPPTNTDVAVGRSGEGEHIAVDRRRERRIELTGRGVEGEDLVPGDDRLSALPVLHLGEGSARDEPVADLDHGQDLAVLDERGEVGRIGGHDLGLGCVHRAGGRAGREQGSENDHHQGQGKGTATTHCVTFLLCSREVSMTESDQNGKSGRLATTESGHMTDQVNKEADRASSEIATNSCHVAGRRAHS